MTNLANARLASKAARLAASLGVAAVLLTGTLVVPAHAENHPNGDAARHAPQRLQVADREHWRGEHRHTGRDGGRDGYYGAPPVIYAPQGYYEQPGPSVYFGFPFLR